MSYGPPGGYPPAGNNYPPRENPPSGNYPPPGNYPPAGGYPPQGGYPPPTSPPANYPPPGNYGQPPGGYPPQGGYPPPGNYPPQGGYPPATGDDSTREAPTYGGPPQYGGQYGAPPAPPPYTPPGMTPYNPPPPPPYGQYNAYVGGYAAVSQESLFWWRALTAVIDFIIIGVARSVIGAIFALILGVGAFSLAVATGSSGGFFGRYLVYSLLTAIVGAALLFAYEGIVIFRNNGKTLGSMVTGVQVRSADGNPVTQDQSFRRAGFQAVVYLIASVVGIIPLIGWVAWIALLAYYFAPLWNPSKQAYHDKYAGTYVVKVS